jgi:cell shape-determining protein MreC
MSSKRKKSRLTKADVSTIIDLQRDLSFAEQIAIAIIGMTKHRDNPCYKSIPVFINDSDNEYSSIFHVAWDAVDDKMKEFDALQAENKSLKEELEKLKSNKI